MNDYEVETCTECLYAGYPDPDDFSCDYIACGIIDDCVENYCSYCDDSFNRLHNCILDDACNYLAPTQEMLATMHSLPQIVVPALP